MQRWGRGGIALCYLLLGALFNLVLQVWVDQVPADYPVDFVLWDLGFVIFPNDLPKYAPDIALLILLVVAFIRLVILPLPDRRPRGEVPIRFAFVWGTIYFLRGFTVGLTRFPRITPTGPLPLADGLFAGLWHILSGSHPSESDFMFSGHTAAMTLFALFVSYYTYHHLFAQFFWILTLCGYWTILAARTHYSADMVVAIIIAICTFTLFHAFVDPDWLSGWRSCLVVEFPATRVVLPLSVSDESGKTWNVNISERGTLRVSHLGNDTLVMKPSEYHVGHMSSATRRVLYKWIIHLLGGH